MASPSEFGITEEVALTISSIVAVLGLIGAGLKYVLDRTLFKEKDNSAHGPSETVETDLSSLVQLIDRIDQLRDQPTPASPSQKKYKNAMNAAQELAKISSQLRPLPLTKLELPKGVRISKIENDKIGFEVETPPSARAFTTIFMLVWCAGVFTALSEILFIPWWLGLALGITFAGWLIYRGTTVTLQKNSFSYSSPGAWGKVNRKPEPLLKVRAKNGRYQSTIEVSPNYIIGTSELHDSQDQAVAELIDFHRSLNWWLERPIEVTKGVYIDP